MILFFGMIFGGDNGASNISVSVGIVDRDQTEISRGFAGGLKAVPVFKQRKGTEEELQKSLENGKLNYILIIPENFKNEDGTYKPLELKYDPSQVNINQIGLPMFEQVVFRMNLMFTKTEPVLSLKKTEVKVDKEEYRYIDWFVPGILAMALLASALFGIGVVITEEREKGQLRRFAVSPVPKFTYVGAQLLQRFIVTILQGFVIIGIGTLVFGVKMKGNWLVLLFVLTVGLLAFSAIGYAMAARIRKAQTSAAVANIIFMPMLFLSGVYFPLEMMPSYLGPVAKALPLTYLNDALRLVFNGRETFDGLLVPLLVLTGWLVVCFVIAVKTFIWD